MTRYWRAHLDGPFVERTGDGLLPTPTLSDVRSLARSKTEAAINVLAAIMHRETTNTVARVAAAKTLLEWGWGKPEQLILLNEAAPETINRCERVIVHPDRSETPIG